MNVPEAFKESRLDVLHAFMRAAPFATLVTNGELGPMAIH
ncbi:MAG: FMN-binding negative transcriptional regulator, partial [Pseudomonadota bacterium]